MRPPAKPLAPRHLLQQRWRRVWFLLAILLGLLAFAILPWQHALRKPGGLPALDASLSAVYQHARDSSLKIEIQYQHGFIPVTHTVGIGSGFFISAGGLALTAYHVIDSPSLRDAEYSIVGITPDGERYPLEVVGFDARTDLAVLQATLRGRRPSYLPLSFVEPKVGDAVVAIGNSNGDFLAPRTGRVTALDVTARRADFASGTIKLDARLAQGDSGGPVLNRTGEVIGVVSYISYIPEEILERNRERLPSILQGVLENSLDIYASYAVPVSTTSEVVAAITAGEKRDVPVIGIYGGDVPLRPAWGSSLGTTQGAIVQRVQEDSPADAAGLRDCQVFRGIERVRQPCDPRLLDDGYRLEVDIITAVDDALVEDFNSMIARIRQYDIGDTIHLTVQRGSQTLDIPLTLQAKGDIF